MTPTHPTRTRRVALPCIASHRIAVRGRERVFDFCRDATHVYARAPARPSARRSDPGSRKGRPRSGAARQQLRRSPPICHRFCGPNKSATISTSPLTDLSEKNPLVELPHDASVYALLGIFSSGAHRGAWSAFSYEPDFCSLLFIPVLVKSPAGSPESHLGMISDRRLLAYFNAFAHSSSGATPPLPSVQPSSSFLRYVSNPLSSLPLPSLNLHFEVVAVHSGNSVLDAMRMMSEMGVSSVAVLEEEGGGLLSAISVTDVGQVGAERVGIRPSF